MHEAPHSPHLTAVAQAEPGERIFKLLDRVPRVRSSSKGSHLDPPPRGDIVFDRVTFSYGKKAENAPPVLSDFSLSIPAGTHVGFVGASGSGKSTTLALMQRFYDPEEGAVLLDGRDLRDCNLDWLYSHLAAISSSSVLFAGSIEENLRYGRPSATNRDLQEVCEQACITEEVESLPDRLRTSVTVLSSSLRQRLAIARVMLRNPRIVLLDEVRTLRTSRYCCHRAGGQRGVPMFVW